MLFCVLFVGSVTFLIIADVIVKPIYRLTKATNELSKGNYKVRVNYSGDDEIARLNRSFNQMATQLAKQEVVRQQFISDVSHEFQTPLTAIQGFAAILKNEKISDEQRVKYADIILFHSKRLSTLSKNMLQLTLLEGEDVKLEMNEFSLSNQLNRVIETQDNLAISKDIEIETSRLALIPLNSGKEVLAYEFSGNGSDGSYFVYINAVTGKEVQIFKVVSTDDGELLL